MSDKDAAMQQALDALLDLQSLDSQDVWLDRWSEAITALKAALEQPEQEPTPWRDMIVVTLVREGINKHKARELADHFAAQPVQEPVGEVVEVNNDGFKCEFNQRLAVGAKLYTTPPAVERPWVALTEQDMPSGEDPMFDHKYFIAGMVYAAKVLQEKNNAAPAAQPEQQAEPVACRFCHSKKGCWTWQCYHCGEIDDVQQPALPLPVQPEPLEYWNAVEGWVKIDEVREHFAAVNCGTIYKHGGEGRVPLYTESPQRPWVGLTEEERNNLEDALGLVIGKPLFDAIEAALKEHNHG